MTAIVVSMVAGLGTFFWYTAVALRWTGVGIGPRPGSAKTGNGAQDWLRQAGIDQVGVTEFFAVELLVLAAGTVVGWLLFGAPVPSMLVGLGMAGAPAAWYRARRAHLRELANDAWPRLLEEIRLQTTTMGRSIPLAMLDVGRRAPTAPMAVAFDHAYGEWVRTTDFTATITVLKAQLADPTADAACETLLVAHEVGGADLDRRLSALIEDRVADLQSRKDAHARQAGVRFARWFTILAPLGLALVGLSIGNGRAAYQSSAGQLAVAIGIALTAVCWWWANRIMTLPLQERVFDA